MTAPIDFQKDVTAAYPSLLIYARSLAKNRDAAEDLAQETVLKAFSNHDKFEAGTNLKAWLTTICRNEFLSQMRKRSREVEDVDGAFSANLAVSGGQEDGVDVDRLMEVIDALPEAEGSLLRDVADGVTIRDAAEKYGVAEGTIKSRVNRTRTALGAVYASGDETTRAADTAPAAVGDLRCIDPEPFRVGAVLRDPAAAGPAPVMEWVPVEKLRIDPRYQREILKRGRQNVLSIAAEFDWSKFATVIVASIEGGLYAIVDGQHRTTAAALCGIKSVPCQIIFATPAQQASAFAAINGNVTQMSPLQIHAANVAAGDAEALAVTEVCERAGVTICRYPKPESTIGAGETMAVRCLYRAVSVHGPAVVGTALQCITKTGNGNRGYLRAPVIVALCSILSRRPDLVSTPERAVGLAKALNLPAVFLKASVDAKAARRPIGSVLADRMETAFGAAS